MDNKATKLTSVELRSIGEHRFYKMHEKKVIAIFLCIMLFALLAIAAICGVSEHDKEFISANGDSITIIYHDKYIVVDDTLYEYKDNAKDTTNTTAIGLTAIGFVIAGIICMFVYWYKQAKYAHQFVDEYTHAFCSKKAD